MKDKQRIFLKEYSSHYNKSRACKVADISRPTFYNWERDDKEFQQYLSAIDQGFVDAAESVLFDTILNSYKTDKQGEVIEVDGVKQRSKEALDAAKFILARKGKDRGYVESIDINADIRAMQTKLLSKEEIIDITPEEMKQLFLEELKNG